MSSASATSSTDWWKKKSVRWIGALLALGVVAFAVIERFGEAPRAECREIDELRPRGVIFTKPDVARQKPMLYCSCLSDAARRTSSTWLEVALAVAAIGALCALFGGALGPAPDAQPGTLRAQRGILLTGIGALLIAFATYCNARSTVASTVAAEAHAALTLADETEMFTVCIRAKSFWISSRVESASQLFDQLGATPVARDKDDSAASATRRRPSPTPTPTAAD